MCFPKQYLAAQVWAQAYGKQSVDEVWGLLGSKWWGGGKEVQTICKQEIPATGHSPWGKVGKKVGMCDESFRPEDDGCGF